MPEPSIQDILSLRPDPELGTGTPAVVYDTKDLVHTLNQADQQKAENDWRKYNMFMGNLKEVYKDLNEIAKQPVLTEDRDKLKQTMGEIMKGISSDPKGFFGGGAKYQETLAKLAQLQSETTESKQNNLYDTAHRQYFYANPHLDTPENRSLVEGYRQQPLGARNPYMLKLPPMFDMKGALENLNKIAVSKTETPTGTGYIENVEGVDPAKWDEAARAFFFTGKDVKEYFTQRFEEAKKASPSSVAPYANSQNPVLDFYLDLMKGGQQATSRTLTGDTAWQTKQQEAGATKRANISASTSREINQKTIEAQFINSGLEKTNEKPYAVPSGWDVSKQVDQHGTPFSVLGVEAYTVDGKTMIKPVGLQVDPWGNLWKGGAKYVAGVNALNRKGVKPAGIMGGDPLKFWDENILPQINNPKGNILVKTKKGEDIAANFTGTVEVEPSDILGLDDILGEHLYEGEKTDHVNKLELKFKDGKVVGIIIDGHNLNKDAVNMSVTNFQNRSMANSADRNILPSNYQ